MALCPQLTVVARVTGLMRVALLVAFRIGMLVNHLCFRGMPMSGGVCILMHSSWIV